MNNNTVPDKLWQRIDDAYDSLDNYLVVDDPSFSAEGEKTCAIYFSGNGIFFPKTEQNFEQQILERNRFEWFGTRIVRATRHIFLRDLKMCWYQEGVNARLNSIEKVLEFLRDRTRGCRTVCVGSSAGGYAALLFSTLLRSDRCFAFSPCVDVARCICLHRGHIGGCEYWHPRYNDYASPHGRYNNLLDLLGQGDCTRYVCAPLQSVIDRPEYSTLRGMHGFRFLRFNSAVHGVGLPREVVRAIINLEGPALDGLFDDVRSWDLLPLVWRYSGRRTIGSAIRLAKEDLGGRSRPYARKRFYANLVSLLRGARCD